MLSGVTGRDVVGVSLIVEAAASPSCDSAIKAISAISAISASDWSAISGSEIVAGRFIEAATSSMPEVTEFHVPRTPALSPPRSLPLARSTLLEEAATEAAEAV